MADLKLVQNEGVLSSLQEQQPDALLAVMRECRADPRNNKIDLTVGMYCNAQGVTPVMRCIKKAEEWLLKNQISKGYLGPEGDLTFVDLLKPFVFSKGLIESGRVTGVQTPGGTGALRLAGDVLRASGRNPVIWLGIPTWGNYKPLFVAAGLKVETYSIFDVKSQTLLFENVVAALHRAKPGDAVVLQASCGNPTGASFTEPQWAEVGELLVARKLVPIIDIAYQGLGKGFAEDVQNVQGILNGSPEALIAYSCDKNFGVYRERVGALFGITRVPGHTSALYSHMVSLARTNWSMPSDHGAAIVRHVLESDELRAEWRTELNEMRERILSNRVALAECGPRFSYVRGQEGMFSMLDLPDGVIPKLKHEHAIYMASSGRINIAGFRGHDIPRFAAAVEAVF